MANKPKISQQIQCGLHRISYLADIETVWVNLIFKK
jgi:hypothetical protein